MDLRKCVQEAFAIEQNASAELGMRLITSFGAFTTIFGFMRAHEVVQFQGVCKFMYRSGVSRVQTYFRLDLKCFFTRTNRDYQHNIFTYDLRKKEPNVTTYKKLSFPDG